MLPIRKLWKVSPVAADLLFVIAGGTEEGSGVRRIPQTVTQEVVGENGKEDEESRDDQPGVVLHHFRDLAVLQQQSPRRIWLRDTEAQIGKGDFSEDIVRDVEGGGHDNDGRGVGQQVAQDYPKRRASQ